MNGSELLSKQRRYNIGQYKNLNVLTANNVTLDYLNFGIDANKINITYPSDVQGNGYKLVLPNRSGVSGEFLGIDNENNLRWGNPNVINNVNFIYGDILNTSLIDDTYVRGEIIFPENYEITITPSSTTSKILIQFRCTYIASFGSDSAITFHINKTINGVDTNIQTEAKLGPLNATGTNRSQYVTSSIIEAGTTEQIKLKIGFSFDNLRDIPGHAGKIGILGLYNNTGNGLIGYSGYKNSIIVTEFEGSGAYSTLLSKSHDNKSIYYNLGTLFLGNNFDSLNTNNISSLSLKTEDGISAPLFIGHLQGNVTGNYIITDNVTCSHLSSNIIINDELIGNIITNNLITTNVINSNTINTNTITAYDISINNSLKTNNLDVYGNLYVHGTQTIVNSETLNVADNIIIVNADGNIERQAGIQANINGNIYSFLFDMSLNGWSIYDQNFHVNKLFGNNITITENIIAHTLNSNITNVEYLNVSENADVNHISINGNISINNSTFVIGNLIPSIDDTYSLGAIDREWRDIYVGPGTLYINKEPVLFHDETSNTINITSHEDNNITLKTTGENGQLELRGSSGHILINTVYQGNVNIIAHENISLESLTGIIELKSNVNGLNAIFSENVTATEFNGNLLANNIQVDGKSIFNDSITGTNINLSGNLILSKFDKQWIQLGNNILGENNGDFSGFSCAFNGDGNILAVGAIYNSNTNGLYSGHVRVYQYDSTTNTWNQLGSDIDGESAFDNAGNSISLNNDGTIIAIGSYRNDTNGSNSGHVRIFSYNGNNWIQLGQNIEGDADNDLFGISVSINDNGNIVAIGGIGYDSNSGIARIYKYINNVWIQLGNDIESSAIGENLGNSISINGAGNIVVIGARYNSINGTNKGRVCIYNYDGNSWIQLGQDLYGENNTDNFGDSVSINSEGNIIAIGAHYYDNTLLNTGFVKIFRFNNNTNNWLQIGNNIEGTSSNEQLGKTVIMNKIGDIVAIGGSTTSDYVKVFKNINESWVQYGYIEKDEEDFNHFGASISINDEGNRIAIGDNFNDLNGRDSGKVTVYYLEDNIISGDILNIKKINFADGTYIDTFDKNVLFREYLDSSFGNVDINGNLYLNNEYILDISAIRFSDGNVFNYSIFNEEIVNINSNIENIVTNQIPLLGNISTLQTEVSNNSLNISTLQTEVSNNIDQSIKTTSNVIFNNITANNELIVKGNLKVLGHKSEFISENHYTYDNIITLNADGSVIDYFGIEGNVDGIIHSFLFDVNNNEWNTQGSDIRADIIGNIAGDMGYLNQLNMFGNINLNNKSILDISSIKFSDGNVFNYNILNNILNDNLNNNLLLINANVANNSSNIATLQGNIITLQNQIEQGITANSNVIFNNVDINGELNVNNRASFNQVVIFDNIDYLSDHINLEQNFTLDPGPWGQIGGNINIRGNNLNVYKDLNVSNNTNIQNNLSVNGNVFANKIIGELSGNSLTSNKWITSKLLNVNGNISGNVLINANEAMNLNLELENFGISGIYGNNKTVPIITIDNYGRITDISLIDISFSSASNSTSNNEIINAQYISSDIIATSGYIRTNKIIGTSITVDSDDFSVEGIMTATHINADSITIANGSITVNKIISSNAIFTNDITVTGNLSVLGTQTILNSTVVEIDDNIIIVNADGELLKEAGISANINGNIYSLVYDICSNSWTTKNNNLTSNIINANNLNIVNNVNATTFNGVNGIISGNINASLFNGNFNGNIYKDELYIQSNNINISGNLNLLKNVIKDISSIYFSDGSVITTGNVSFTEYLDASFGYLDLSGNLNMRNNIIKDISSIYFSDGSVITTGNVSFTEYLDASFGNLDLSGNLILKENQGLLFHDGTFINSVMAAAEIISQDSIITDLSIIKTILNNYLYDTNITSNTYFQTIDQIIINGNIRGNTFIGNTFEGDLIGNISNNNLYIKTENIDISNILSGTSNNLYLHSSNIIVNNSATINNDLLVQGNLTVKGTKTIVDSIEHIISDSLITLNSQGTNENIGIEGNTANNSIIKFVFDQNNNYWHTNGKSINANIIGDISGTTANLSNLNMIGNVNIYDNYILDVSAIRFSDGRYFNNTILNGIISIINSNITTLQNDVLAVEGNVTTLQNEVLAVEGNVTTLQNDILTVEGNITTLQNDIAAVEGNVTTLQNHILTVEGNVTTLENDILTVEGNITTLQNDIVAVEGNVITLQNNFNQELKTSSNVVFNRLSLTNELVVHGNLTVKGNTTEIQSINKVLHDNILTLNADGKIINDIGIEGNIGGNIYSFLYDNANSYWHTDNKPLKANLIGDVIGNIKGNLIGNITGTTGNLNNLNISNNIDILGTTNIQVNGISSKPFQVGCQYRFDNIGEFAQPVYFKNGFVIEQGRPDFLAGLTLSNQIAEVKPTASIGIHTANPQKALDVNAESIFRNTITASNKINLTGNLSISKSIYKNWSQIGEDISGISSDDNFGTSVSLNSNGNIIAIGAPYNNSNATNSGLVQIYEISNNTWNQLGQDICGSSLDDNFGYMVSINNQGNIVAISSPNSDINGSNAGLVQIYEISNNTWNQLGQDICGSSIDDNFGYSISINGYGNVVGIGAPYNSNSANNSGLVRIYENINNTWTQMGSDLTGSAEDDNFGFAVSINGDGTRIAIGAPKNDGNGSNSGHVRVYDYNGSSWNLVGQEIKGEALDDQSGYSVSLSKDGTRLAIGAPYNDGNGSDSGHVRIYQYNHPFWIQLGNDINGDMYIGNTGYSVSLNNDGSRIIIGEPNSINGAPIGLAKVYEYDSVTNLDWVELGQKIYGKFAEDKFGYSVSMSSDGKKIAIGAPYNDVNGIDSGEVRVYNLETNYIDSNIDVSGGATFNSDVNIFGNLTLGGTLNYSSDRRLKDNITDIENGISLIKKLKPLFYEKRNKIQIDDSNYYIKESGFIAQDIENMEELNHLINKPKNIENDVYTMNYTGIIPYNTAAIKELNAIVEEQQEKINKQEIKINELINRIELLEKS